DLASLDACRGAMILGGYTPRGENGIPGRRYFHKGVPVRTHHVHAFAVGDEVEAQALLKMDRGRLILTQVRAVHFETRSGAPAWTNSQALVAKSGATYFPRQSGNCLHCPHGALVDVTERLEGRVRERRDLYCLAGMQDQRECHLYALHKVDVCWQQA
nr:hypothetical protein [bacterium]